MNTNYSIIVVISIISAYAMENETEKRLKILETEFVHIIEHPFEKPEKETLKQLRLLLAQGINPYVLRKSCYEMCALDPIPYLLHELKRTPELQKSRIVEMIFMMCHPLLDEQEVS